MLFSFLWSLLHENGRLFRFLRIFIAKRTRCSNDKSRYFAQPCPVIILLLSIVLHLNHLVSAEVFCRRKNHLWCFLKTVVLVLGVVPNIFWLPGWNTFLFFLSTESMSWENVVMDQYDDSIPRARAGHCSVAVSLKKMLLLCLFYLVNGL